jgi:hypothetical protein
MVRRFSLAVGISMFVLVCGAASAQQRSTSTETKKFEIIHVDGNRIVVREAAGTREYAVPESFRFRVGEKSLSVHELEPGMKGTATITTTTTVTPVTVTEVKEATVAKAMGSSVIVRGPQGYRMFSAGDVDKQHIRILRDGRAVNLSELREGDRLTATIVTAKPPRVLTEREVKATIAEASLPQAPAPSPAAEPPSLPAPAAPEPPAATPQAAAQPSAPATIPEARREGSSVLWMILGLAALLAVVFWIWNRSRTAG